LGQLHFSESETAVEAHYGGEDLPQRYSLVFSRASIHFAFPLLLSILQLQSFCYRASSSTSTPPSAASAAINIAHHPSVTARPPSRHNHFDQLVLCSSTSRIASHNWSLVTCTLLLGLDRKRFLEDNRRVAWGAHEIPCTDTSVGVRKRVEGVRNAVCSRGLPGCIDTSTGAGLPPGTG